MIKNKKAVSALVATVLLILVTVAAVGIIWGAIMPMLNRAMEIGEACMTARLNIDTTRGYTCYDSSKKQVSVMIARGAEDFELAGIQVGLSSGGTSKSYNIKSNASAGSGGIDSYTKLLLHADGTNGSTTFTDSEPTPKTVTANGQVYTDTRQSKFGGSSGFFDGTGDYLSLGDSADWDFVNADWTVDFWVRFNSVAASRAFLGQFVNDSNFWGISWSISNSRLYFYQVGEGVDTYGYFSWSPSIDTWYHIAFVRSGNTLYIFINGVSQSVTLDGWNTFTGLAATLSIGLYSDQTWYHSGWLDELRISKGIARWASNFDVPMSEYTTSIPAIGMPQQNEAKTYIINTNALGVESVEEATIAPIVKVGNSEKVCGISSKVQVPKCA